MTVQDASEGDSATLPETRTMAAEQAETVQPRRRSLPTRATMEKREVNSPYGSKLDSAGLLILGMEGLRPGCLVPVSEAAIRDAGSVNAVLDRQRIGAALTSAVLYAFVVELVVKHIWEHEHGKMAERSHDVHRLFQALSSQTRREVEALYNNCCVEYKSAVQTGKQQHGPGAVAVDMADFDEALQWNKDAVKDLKYEMTPRGRSVPTGLFWNSDHVWVVLSAFPNFAIELVRWAARKSFKKPTP